MWINKFKIALIEKDFQSLGKLLEDVPDFSDVKSMKEVSFLMQDAIGLLQNEKSTTAHEMHQIKKTLDFLNASASDTKNNFDIKS